jgi:serine protease
MPTLRLARFAMALAPLLALLACDQVGDLLDRAKGGGGGGPIALERVRIDARAVAGVVRPAGEAQGLLAAEPLLVVPGEIVVGARVEQELLATATAMGLAAPVLQALRAGGEDALAQLPQNVVGELRSRAEAEAGDAARDAARNVLQRLGVSEPVINISPGGLVTVNVAPEGASPTRAPFMAQQSAPEAGGDEPSAIPWDPNASCPRIVTQGALEADVALATHCAIARLAASRQFAFVEPNFIATSGFDNFPFRRAREEPPPAAPSSPPPASTPSGAPAPQPQTPPAAGALPNDPLLALQWHYKPRGGEAGQAPGGAGFEAFWLSGQVGARDVRVAVVDTGIDRSHPEIRTSPNVAPGVDLISAIERAGDANGVDDDPNDAGDRCGAAAENSYHGTHVAGTIGAVATNDGVGVAGGAWNVTLVPVRVLGKCGGELADIVGGIRWAAGLAPAIAEGGAQIVNANPADIINMSLSIMAPCPASMQAAIDAASARGALIVAAAGNKANNANLYAPANCQNVIVVAAGDEQGKMSFYSNFGPAVDILAPGGDVFADQDQDGRPDGVLSSRTSATNCYDPVNNGAIGATCYYSYLQGTSMAAPHVSAALALLAAQTGLRGAPLEDVLFTRAISPLYPDQGVGPCARFPNAFPIPDRTGMCDRPGGRGMLDLGRAAPVGAVAGGGGR